MKKAFIAIAILFSISATAQNYNDSVVTTSLTQRAAVYIGFGIQQSFSWSNRLAPTSLKNYIGSGTNLDSLLGPVVLKASYIKNMIEILLSGNTAVTSSDRSSIISNSPSVPGYTSLAVQITTLANGNGPQKETAQFILEYYNQRVADYNNLRAANIQNVVSWSNN